MEEIWLGLVLQGYCHLQSQLWKTVWYIDIKVMLGCSTSRVEFSLGDTGTNETWTSWGLVVSFQDWVRGYRVPGPRLSLRAWLWNCRYRNGRISLGSGPGRHVVLPYQERHSSVRQTGEGMELGSGDSYKNLIFSVWLLLMYSLRQIHLCHVFPHNLVFCANWEMKIQRIIK